MRILAVDAATQACSVSLWCDGQEFSRSSESGKNSAAQILSMVEQCMAEAQSTLSALDAIACSIGPGAFTGVRISVAVSQGLAFGANLPVIPVNTLEALALQALQAGAPLALACLDARMGEVYWGSFAAHAAQGLLVTQAPTVSSPLRVGLPIGEAIYQGIGQGFSVYPVLATLPRVQIIDVCSHALPHAREMGRLGALRFKLGGGLDPSNLMPLYLRDKVALTSAERCLQSQ